MNKNTTDLSMSGSGDDELIRTCSILESIADKYAPGSEQAIAIRDAALAYTVVWQHERLKRQYARLRAAFGGELSEEMKADLRKHGIESDELDDGQAERPVENA
jgi:hypothetical protein